MVPGDDRALQRKWIATWDQGIARLIIKESGMPYFLNVKIVSYK